MASDIQNVLMIDYFINQMGLNNPIKYLRYIQCVLDSKLNFQFPCIHAYASISDTALKHLLTLINMNYIIVISLFLNIN